MLDRAIERFGGVALWARLECITLGLTSLEGPLMRHKGVGVTFPIPSRIHVYPKRQRAEFERLGTFEAGAVDGRTNYRRTFDGFAKYRRWSPSDAVYFFGYALTTYLSVPFILKELKTTTRTHADGSFEVSAEFPDAMHTHNRHQRFFFAPDGLLKRHDYRAEVVGSWATGAHFTSEYRVVDGLPIATRREVFARIGRLVTPIPVLSATIEPVGIR